MIFDVDYDLLNELGIEVIKNNEELVKRLKELLDIVVDFNKSWFGEDSQTFQNTAITYIKELLDTTNDIAYIGGYMRTAAGAYCNSDDKWGKNVKEIGDDYYGREERHAA